MSTSVRSAFLLASSLLVLASLPSAQLREPGVPASSRVDLPGEVPVVVLESDEARALGASIQEIDPGGPFRYGVELGVGLGLEDSGRWDTVESTGELVWRLELDSPGAYSLGVVFRRFDLPEGAQLFLYSPTSGDQLGAYGESAENPNGVLAIQPLRGDRVVIEYVEPAGTLERPALMVDTVVHDYLDILTHMAPDGALAMACLVDVNCPQGATRQDIKRAVVWMVRGGTGCSGSILNNTAEDTTPYMMTAEHCGNFTNGTFVFDYERTGCATGASSQAKTLSGATLLAVSPFYDGQLYRLNQSIPASYEPFYAGWSVSLDVDAPVVGISHPAGLPKKIQVDNQDPFQTPTRWSVDFNVGAIQGGSSGSPLFDQHKRVIGTASTGSSGCSTFANYGRFDEFYASLGLATWLDPMGWGLSGIDGLDGIDPYARPYQGSGVNLDVYSSATDPRLGTTWIAEVDTSSRPAAASTVLVGYEKPSEGPILGLGELLVDSGSPLLFQHASAVVGGLSTHSLPLPPLVALAGRISYTQGFIVGGGVVATNGLKLVLNF